MENSPVTVSIVGRKKAKKQKAMIDESGLLGNSKKSSNEIEERGTHQCGGVRIPTIEVASLGSDLCNDFVSVLGQKLRGGLPALRAALPLSRRGHGRQVQVPHSLRSRLHGRGWRAQQDKMHRQQGTARKSLFF
jgi:hypothetical protein